MGEKRQESAAQMHANGQNGAIDAECVGETSDEHAQNMHTLLRELAGVRKQLSTLNDMRAQMKEILSTLRMLSDSSTTTRNVSVVRNTVNTVNTVNTGNTVNTVLGSFVAATDVTEVTTLV